MKINCDLLQPIKCTRSLIHVGNVCQVSTTQNAQALMYNNNRHYLL